MLKPQQGKVRGKKGKSGKWCTVCNMLKLKVDKAFVFGVFKTKHSVFGLLWYSPPGMLLVCIPLLNMAPSSSCLKSHLALHLLPCVWAARSYIMWLLVWQKWSSLHPGLFKLILLSILRYFPALFPSKALLLILLSVFLWPYTQFPHRNVSWPHPCSSSCWGWAAVLECSSHAGASHGHCLKISVSQSTLTILSFHPSFTNTCCWQQQTGAAEKENHLWFPSPLPLEQ